MHVSDILDARSLAIILAAAVYVTTVVRDWRPASGLRRDKRQLGRDLETAETSLRERGDRIDQLERATVPALQAEIAANTAVLKGLVDLVNVMLGRLTDVESTLRSQTAAIDMLSRRRILDEALHDFADENTGR